MLYIQIHREKCLFFFGRAASRVLYLSFQGRLLFIGLSAIEISPSFSIGRLPTAHLCLSLSKHHHLSISSRVRMARGVIFEK